MYHLQITKSIHATEKKFNNGRKIAVVMDKDYEDINSIESTIYQKFNVQLNELKNENNEYFFEKQEDPSEIAHYLIRISHN